MAGVVTIPAAHGFVEVLADALFAEHGADPLALARVTVFLPTRRSARALREALLRRGGGAALLPRIRPLGDLDEDEDDGADSLPVAAPPAIGALERQLLLAEQVRALPPRAAFGPVSGAQALALAAALARLLDEMQTARVDFTALDRLVPEEFAGHWRETCEFLSIVTAHWPRILAARGAIDPADRRNRVLCALAAEWRRAPPETPVIAAGSTGSVPATADLLATVAKLPRGLVVLPGLDAGLDDASWNALSETHPQYGLKLLLERLEIDRSTVPSWLAPPPPDTPLGARAALIREAMRPDRTVEAWRALDWLDRSAVAGLELVECPDAEAEAEVVALAMRHALETPGRTAALVTTDRGLARRVRAALRRWALDVDDSAGIPLADTPPGVFLRLIVEALARDAAPIPLLAMLKHPLSRGGMNRLEFLNLVRRFERRCLRGPRPAPGFPGLRNALATSWAPEPPPEELAVWFDSLAAAAAPLARALAQDRVMTVDLVAAHREFAEWLATGEDGATDLWAREAGRACRDRLDELAEAATGLPAAAGRDYAATIDAALKGIPIRPARDRHPRLFIRGTLEARLQRADLTVLGGLNEGAWPGEPPADPWLSRPMRRDLGLPAPERLIGLAAHDFAQLAQAPDVLLTRSERVAGAPSVPARWLTRLKAVLDGAGIRLARTPWLAWRRALDRPDSPPAPILSPAPRPPLHARPRELSVTRIEAWMRDPYEIYARSILGLRALDPVDASAAQAEYGSAVHEALRRFAEETPGPLPADALQRLLAIGEAALVESGATAGVLSFWRPRFARTAEWFVAQERVRRAAGVESLVEIDGALAFEAAGGKFRLTARADRLDLGPDGSVTVIDYKIGPPPSEREMLAGFAPQLPLEGAILAAGGFAGLAAAAPVALQYWRLSGGDPAGEIREPKKRSAEALTEDALNGLRGLVDLYDDPETAYLSRPAPKHAPKYSDYEHLARVGEWGSAATEES